LILVACEHSGAVRDAFISHGFSAFSCDLLPAETPGPHIVGNVLDVLHDPRWTALIAFPPCTYLSASGLHWNKRDPEREHKTAAAVEFALLLWNAPIPRIAIENPLGRLSRAIGPPTQIVQPYQFGSDASKRTCLWLRGLPPIQPFEFVPPRSKPGEHLDLFGLPIGLPRWENQADSGQNRLGETRDRWRKRSRTYPGIAAAMVRAWAPTLRDERPLPPGHSQG
jgi:hypothetical protein